MAQLTKRERAVAAKYRKYEKARESAKTFYDRADVIVLDIARTMNGKGRCRIREDGKELILIDHAKAALADDTRAIIDWGHAAVRRFELKTAKP